MATTNVKITDNSDMFRNALDDSIIRALEKIGLTAEAYAKLKCPVDTGRLRNSISHSRSDDTAYIGTNVEYAAYVELGTVNTRAQPYLKPAVADHISEYKRLVEGELKG